jgi:muramoyltetrapeptide carboxypeptidase
MTSPLAWPQPLQAGDRVRLAAASSALDDPATVARLQAGREVLEGWGLDLDSRPIHGRRWGYLAGRDDERRGDLLGADRDGAALVACVRGGWGSARLLERPLVLPPRWLLGFSDVTSLLWAQLAQGHGGSLHGPLLTTLAAEPAWSQERLRQLLFGEMPAALKGQSWGAGVAAGPLLVANLTVATHLLGTAHLPALAGAILVLEDVGEAPYRIDRMLTHWRLSGALGQLAGIAFGAFSDCEDEEETEDDGLSTSDGAAHRRLEQVLRERTLDLGIPVLAGLPLGHRCGNAALPLGAWARLDADAGRLELVAWPPPSPAL